MESGNLSQFVAYQKSLVLFDNVVSDMDNYLTDRRFERLVVQQLASADSVCSNIEEGYGRASAIEFKRFLVIARGSLRETQGRYQRMRHWLPAEIVAARTEQAEEILRMITATIGSLRRKS